MGAIVNYDADHLGSDDPGVIQRSYDYFSRFFARLVIAPDSISLREVDFGGVRPGQHCLRKVLFLCQL